MDGARERGEGGSERSNGAKERSVGGREGGKLQGRYPEEDTGQYTAHKTRPNVVPYHCDFGITNTKLQRVYKLCIVMCRNVLFDRWMT